VNSRRAFRASRRRSRSRGSTWRLGLIVAGTCAAVLVIGFGVRTAHSERAVDTASTSVPGAWSGGGGWGRGGGYTMMPGPAGSAPSRSAPSRSAPSWSGGSGPVERGSAANAPAVTSENWSGYAAAGSPGTFISVSAAWTQPAVTCTATETFSSFWVGLDGDGTTTVEQTGTEADCTGGAASYQGWFEIFPNAPVFYDNPVQPGDAMSASVVADGNGLFTLTLTDSTQGWTRTANQISDTAQLGSAEVITEAPSDGASGGSVLPLADFGTVSFTDASVDGTAIGNEDPSALTMASASGVTEATPSALTGGNAFTVTWDSSGPTGTGPAPTATATAPGRHHHRRRLG
jgi:Peptidase A4 family